MAANDNRWSDLHGDLLVEIARWVKWYEDFVSFGGVCTSWRSAAVSENFIVLSNHFAKTSEVLAVVKLQERFIWACLL
ncbi:hypothetical protein WN944_025469 [Citrus x changshan-huyou]|uniref:F-box domain-containing protein n=1 Tax=Citrus x changshan-huyou TaxID=2935761 RepID=A0AAP0LQG7_9ROSI